MSKRQEFRRAGAYDIHSALQRLKCHTQTEKIKEAGTIEQIFLRTVKLPKKFKPGKLAPCLSSQHTVKRSKAFDRKRVQVKGDGNCLYNAASCAMFRSDEWALQIRLRAAISMATKSKEIKNIHQTL